MHAWLGLQSDAISTRFTQTLTSYWFNTSYHTSIAETDFHFPWNPARRHSTEEES